MDAPETNATNSELSNTRRFWVWFVAATFATSAVAGLALLFQTAFGLQKFGGMEYAPRVIALGVVRELAPGVSSSALVIALLAWHHDGESHIAPAALNRRVLLGAMVAVLMYPLVGALMLVGLLSLLTAWDIAFFEALGSASGVLTTHDAVTGFASALSNVGVVSALAFAFLARYSRLKWPLVAKIVVAMGGIATISTITALVLAPLR